LDERDHDTALHGNRTAGLAEELGRCLDLNPKQFAHLRIAGALHDLGKIGIPDEVLLKPGKFDAHERALMQTHSVRGIRILSAHIDGLGEVVDTGILEIIRHHHEDFDGGGYPDGLRGEGIPLLARVLSLADSYDAMTSVRPYRVPLTHEQTMDVLETERGRRNDPRILDLFQEIIITSPYRAH